MDGEVAASGLDNQSLVHGRIRICVFTTTFVLALGSMQLSIYWLPGTLSTEVKWLECEAHHSFPFSAKVRNALSFTFVSLYVSGAWYFGTSFFATLLLLSSPPWLSKWTLLKRFPTKILLVFSVSSIQDTCTVYHEISLSS
jgi:hypothetical protein